MYKVAYHSSFAHPLPEGHRFPMEKYELIPQQLLHQGEIIEEQLFVPELADLRWVELAHDKNYVERLGNLKLTKQEERKLGFPQSSALFERELRIAQGTIENVHHAIKDSVAFNVAGGTHHAGKAFAEGFCLLNDQAIGAGYALENKLASRILILDLDVHQGNGTADIFGSHSSIYTFSMHGAKNYPMHKPNSHWDIGLEDGVRDKAYLIKLERVLNQLEQYNFELVFYQAGVDVLETDKLGRLSLSIEACAQRDRMVMEWCKENKLPLVVSMGGGYSKDIRVIVDAHCNTYKAANSIYS